MSELKPCPFCGGEAKAMLDKCSGVYFIGCSNDKCLGFSAIGWSYETKYEAISAWNTRAERTCRMTKKGHEFVLAGWWECSECGPVYPPCNDEIAVWALQKCPRCGAKVVE